MGGVTTPRPQDPSQPPVFVCFDVPSREVVDERARWLSEQGAPIESGPAEYDYTPGYYAVLFYDPDGIKLELLHRPTYWASLGDEPKDS